MRYIILSILAFFAFTFPVLAGSGTLKGTINAPGGKPLGGVVVQLRAGSNPVGDLSEKNGAYSIEEIPAGTYDVTFKAAGWGETSRKVSITCGNTTTLNITIAERQAIIPRTATSEKRKSDRRDDAKLRVDMTAARPAGARRSAMAKGEGASTRSRSIESIAPAEPSPAPSATTVDDGPASEAYEFAAGAGAADMTSGVDDMSAFKSSSPAARAGSLTSGESNDFSKWTLWEDMVGPALQEHQKAWGIYTERRYSISVQTATGQPLPNVHVRLMNGSAQLWETFTDNTGRAELWAGISGGLPVAGSMRADITYSGRRYSIDDLKPFGKGDVNMIRTDAGCTTPAKLDIAFIVDATGSMQDEINYLKAELSDILQKVSDSLPKLDVQTASLFYRDLDDEYVTEQSDFAPGISNTLEFLKTHNAGGGGDFPEGVDMALDAALDGLSWREGTVAKIAFLVLDAPPHSDPITVARIRELTIAYAAKGIRLVPIACSGVDKNTEYIMRSMALATNGTYLFLTNHSGIGGAHIEPTTDKYEVEYLNGLVYRVIYQFSYLPSCNDATKQAIDTTSQQQAIDSAVALKWRFFPNPTTGLFTIEYQSLNGEFFITDISGKALIKLRGDGTGRVQVDLSQYPTGMYFIRYQYAPDRWLSGKVTLIR